MGSFYSGDHIAGDHIHDMDITTCIIEEPQQKYCLEMFSGGKRGRGKGP